LKKQCQPALCLHVLLIERILCPGCNAILNRHNGTLTSPAFGHANYPHNQKCTYKIRHPGANVSKLFFFLADAVAKQALVLFLGKPPF
jgi:hypothetical protein